MSIKSDIIIRLKKEKQSKKWKKNNSHNFTDIDGIFNLNQVKVGNGTYGTIHVDSFENYDSRVEIGHFCSIAREVRFLIDGEHKLNGVSSYPFRKRYLNGTGEAKSKGPIFVGDDVWIGERCIILSGVKIGQGAVVGAGSVVAKDIPPYAVFAGGRIIRYRFSEEIIEKLLKFDFGKLTVSDIKEYEDVIYGDVGKFLESELYKKCCRN